MIICCDFDGTCVRQDHPYDDVTSPLQLQPGAKQALQALKRAGHVLILWSARSSRALLIDPTLDPLVRAGIRRVDMAAWRRSQPLNIARHRQMLEFVATELAGIFDAIDDGSAGKPSADLFIDDRALRFGRARGGLAWNQIAGSYGDGFWVAPRGPDGALPIPAVKQETDYTCGAAALLAVLRAYRVDGGVTERDLARQLGTTEKDGTNPTAIARIANTFGVRANWRTGIGVADLNAAYRDGVPVILDVQDPDGGERRPGLPDGHYVVLTAIGETFIEVMNPSADRVDFQRLPLDTFADLWVDIDGRRGGVFVMGPHRPGL